MATLQLSSHQVDILFDSDQNPICAGTLISSYLVLTVFSCLTGKNETKLKVQTSQSDAAGNFQTRNVETIHSFPALRSEPSKNDVAVILLEADFQLGENFRFADLIEHDSPDPENLIALSQSSSCFCGNFPVEKTEQSGCNRTTDNPSSICVKPTQQTSCPLPLPVPVPLIGSGLICQVRGLNFLCGALVGNGGNAREYTDISKYLHWIQLTFDKNPEKDEEDPELYGLGPTMFGGRQVSSSGGSSSIPYQLSLQRRQLGNWTHICGPVIIDEKTALTAAHCFDDKTYGLSDYRVVAGVTHLNSTSKTKQILYLQNITKHFDYKHRNVFRGNDIAVLHVNGSFVYNENVQNIWISPPNGTNPSDFTGRVSGWGKTSNNVEPSNSLQEAEMRILSFSECQKTWTFLKPSMICAYDNASNFCEGDAGGPLVIQNYQFNQNTRRDLLIGIASFAPKDCEKRDTANGFTEVSHFSDWIQENRALKCGASEFQCLNGQCIDECLLCDGIDECGDGSDEEGKECLGKISMDSEKKTACALKKQEKCETRGGEIRNEIKTKNRKIQELEELVKSLKTTIGKISKNTDGQICLDGADSSDVTFYEDSNFSGSEIKVKAGCSCQEIPEEWKTRVSSLKSSSCVTFFRGRKCSDRRPQQQQQLTGNQADLSLFNLDNQVSSFELCAATAERSHQREQPPKPETTRKEEDVLSLRTTSIGVGGRLADFRVESFPYQLSLQERQYGEWEHTCGAVLLDERTALTAANVFHKRSRPADFRLVAGMKRLDENESLHQVRSVQRIIKHFSYSNPFLGGDIALLTVNGSFILTEDVRPVWISSPDEPILSDFNGTATGWGKFNNSRILSNHLKVMELPLLPFEKCKEMLHFFKDSMICARTGYSNVCNGDGGGPLVLKNYEFPDGSKRDLLVGITSFGPNRCEDLTLPSGFTKLSSHYEWIHRYWKRNTNTNTVNKFKCFSGQEIEEDWRCDEEFDCVDGSDEKGCSKIKDEDRPKTQRCGGEIQLQTEEHDIIYRVEDSEPGKMVQCVWTIFNEKSNPIELTLLNNTEANFDPKKNQLIALHNFTLQNFDHKLLTRTDQKIKISDSFTTLIFRGSAGTQNSGSGFHLRVKSLGLNREENPLKFKRVDLNSTFTLQNHSYPSSGFYGVNERVFTILSPSQNGSRIRLNLAFGEMEGNRDWFDIISIGQQPKSLFRLSGARSWTNNANVNSSVIEGASDESLLLFMSTASPAVKRKGIRFTYSQF